MSNPANRATQANGRLMPPEAHRFKPGQSGNPGGRPKEVRELLALARTAVPQAFALAAKFLRDSEEDSRVRLEAAKFLTSYGIGAPPKEQPDGVSLVQVNIVIPGGQQ